MLIRKYFSILKTVCFIVLSSGFKPTYAHNPDIASLMIYEQNGKSILLIKSSLTAFEGEVDYVFGKNAYKTPEEFNQLVIQHFIKNCSLIVNGNKLDFSNIQVQLGHETNLFAELINMPEKISAIDVKCALFKDMSNNKCTLILATKGLPQQQYLLNNSNNHQVKLKVEDNTWVVEEENRAFYLSSTFIIGVSLLILLLISSFFVFNRK